MADTVDEDERFARAFCRLAGIRVTTTALDALREYLLRPSLLNTPRNRGNA